MVRRIFSPLRGKLKAHGKGVNEDGRGPASAHVAGHAVHGLIYRRAQLLDALIHLFPAPVREIALVLALGDAVEVALRLGVADKIDGSHEVLARVRATVEDIARANPGKTLALFSHGYAIRLLLANLQGISLRDTGEKSPPPPPPRRRTGALRPPGLPEGGTTAPAPGRRPQGEAEGRRLWQKPIGFDPSI